MSFQITYNSKGEPLGVFIPMEQWEEITRKYQDLKEMERAAYTEPTKEEIIAGIKQGMKEAQLHLEGGLDLSPAAQLLQDLRQQK